MKYLTIILLLLISIVASGQITGTIEYRYYYNSEVVFEQIQKDYLTGNDYAHQTVAGQHANTLIGGNVNIPFNVFDEESPIYSNRFSLDAAFYLQTDHTVNRLVQHYSMYGLNFKPIKSENFHITTKLNVSEVFNNPQTTVVDGFDYKIGLSYNVVDQEFPDMFNFYAELNYIVFGEYNTLFPYGNHFVSTHDIHNTIGFVVNIKDFFFVEQNITTLTESNFPSLTFSPYYSDYKTKIWIRYKMFDLAYQHTCYHPMESDNPNPKIYGVMNHVALEFNF